MANTEPTSRPLHIAVVASTESVRRRIAATLGPALPEAVVAPCRRYVELEPEQLSALDLVICQDAAPAHEGLQSLRRLQERRPDLPVVVIAIDGDAERALCALRAGAAEALHSQEWQGELLAQAVRRALQRRSAAAGSHERIRRLGAALSDAQLRIRELELLAVQLRDAAMTDPLTGLLNRRAAEARLDELFALASRHKTELSCLMIDVDGLKAVNDTLGHCAGDALLRTLADVICEQCRRSDIAARCGGDEFIVLLPQTPAPLARLISSRLCAAFDQRISDLRDALRAAGRPDITIIARTRPGAGPRPIPSVSIGVASTAAGAATPAALLDQADAALYAAKRAGPAIVPQRRAAAA